MKISLINGSPKTGTSCSGVLLNQLQQDVLDKGEAKGVPGELYHIQD